VTGALGALGAPWMAWRVDRERIAQQARRERLTEWRTGLTECERLELMDTRVFLTSAWYASLRPHLTPTEVEELEFTPYRHILVAEAGTQHRHRLAVMLADAIDRIATAWGLE
jgi:hypothetical protein